MDIITWLENWYASNCDGDWEHIYGITIETLDNPGWLLKLNVLETIHEDTIFNDVIIERTDTDWIHCRKRDGNIDCACGSRNLNEMLGIIKKWMEEQDRGAHI
jgi:hypothetical protein